jgi:hypothetical protein
MARFRLLAPHYLEIGYPQQRMPVLCDAGTEIDSASMPPWWKPSPAVEPLDNEAMAMLKEVCDAARAANPGSVPGFGCLHRHPGGDIYELEAKANR